MIKTSIRLYVQFYLIFKTNLAHMSIGIFQLLILNCGITWSTCLFRQNRKFPLDWEKRILRHQSNPAASIFLLQLVPIGFRTVDNLCKKQIIINVQRFVRLRTKRCTLVYPKIKFIQHINSSPWNHISCVMLWTRFIRHPCVKQNIAYLEIIFIS